MSRSSTRVLPLVAAAVAAAAAGIASAQVQLEEVTVTARKRAESLQEIPMSVTAFTAESIEARGIRNVQDVIKYTPGLSFDKGFAPQDTRPNIRGLPTTRGRPPVGMLLDGIDISSESIATAGGSSLMNLKLVDVERIEVVKGPQSALYGRVAFGGAINYISKKPQFDKVDGTASLDVATDGLYEARGAVNLPISDAAAWRLNGIYSKFDGFFKNEISGAKLGGWDTKVSRRPCASSQPTPPTSRCVCLTRTIRPSRVLRSITVRRSPAATRRSPCRRTRLVCVWASINRVRRCPHRFAIRNSVKRRTAAKFI